MKLISMTDFVLEQAKLPIHRTDVAFNCIQYAKFLKQPLTLGMFVPCDENGNVLSQPADDNYAFYTHKNLSVQEEYKEAQERVLFKHFKLIEYDDSTTEIISDTAPSFITVFKKLSGKDWDKRFNTVEDLIASKIDIDLTDSAIKQIGL